MIMIISHAMPKGWVQQQIASQNKQDNQRLSLGWHLLPNASFLYAVVSASSRVCFKGRRKVHKGNSDLKVKSVVYSLSQLLKEVWVCKFSILFILVFSTFVLPLFCNDGSLMLPAETPNLIRFVLGVIVRVHVYMCVWGREESWIMGRSANCNRCRQR